MCTISNGWLGKASCRALRPPGLTEPREAGTKRPEGPAPAKGAAGVGSAWKAPGSPGDPYGRGPASWTGLGRAGERSMGEVMAVLRTF